MVILGGWVFLMSEEPVQGCTSMSCTTPRDSVTHGACGVQKECLRWHYARVLGGGCFLRARYPCTSGRDRAPSFCVRAPYPLHSERVQGYLAHKKSPPP